MKSRMTILEVGLLLGLALTVSFEAFAGSMVMRRFKGDVTLLGARGTPIEVVKDGFVPPGSTVITKSNGRCILAASDGSIFKISPDSRVEVSSLMTAEEGSSATTSLLLAMGHVSAEVQKAIGDEETVRIVTMSAVAGVRGTAFDVVVGPDGQTTVQVTEGLVAVDSDQAEPIEVKPGNQVNADPERVGTVRGAETKKDWTAARRNASGKRLVSNVKSRFDGAREGVKRRSLKLQRVRSKLRDAARALRAAKASGASREELRARRREVRRLRSKLNRIIEQSMATIAWSSAVEALLSDPRFDQIPAKYVRRELASLQAVRASLDALAKEGRDLSQGSMEDMLKQNREGRRGTLRDSDGSAADELFKSPTRPRKSGKGGKKKSGSSIFDDL